MRGRTSHVSPKLELGNRERKETHSIEHAGQLQFDLYGAVLVDLPVYTVLVIRGGEDLGDHQLSTSRADDVLVSEVSVFEQDSSIFLVYADCILDHRSLPGPIGDDAVQVVNRPLAVASQLK